MKLVFQICVFKFVWEIWCDIFRKIQFLAWKVSSYRPSRSLTASRASRYPQTRHRRTQAVDAQSTPTATCHSTRTPSPPRSLMVGRFFRWFKVLPLHSQKFWFDLKIEIRNFQKIEIWDFQKLKFKTFKKLKFETFKNWILLKTFKRKS